MAVAEILTGIALITKSVEFLKSTLGTAKDISSVAKQIDDLFEGSKQLKVEERKARQNGQSVTEIVINQQLAAEHIAEVKKLIIGRFGYYAWQDILKLQREAQLEQKARAAAKRRQQEAQAEIRGDMAVVGTSVLIGILIIAIVAAVLLAIL
jgi:hypothetical protein